jgi:hypothetical protein
VCGDGTIIVVIVVSGVKESTYRYVMLRLITMIIVIVPYR